MKKNDLEREIKDLENRIAMEEQWTANSELGKKWKNEAMKSLSEELTSLRIELEELKKKSES